MIYEQLQLSDCGKAESNRKKSPSYRRDSLVSRTHLQERVSAMVTSVTCGERLQDVSENLNRAGLSVKIRPVCLPELVRNTFAEYLPTLPRWGTVCRGEYGELATSEHLTSETGCSLSVGTPTCTETKRSAKFRAGRTPNLQEFVEKFPTPLSSDAIRARYSEESLKKVGERRMNGEYKLAGCNLTEYVAVYPTPLASSWGSKGCRDILQRRVEDGTIPPEEKKKMISGNGGKLNPTWVEWLMSFPLGWTDLDVSETR